LVLAWRTSRDALVSLFVRSSIFFWARMMSGSWCRLAGPSVGVWLGVVVTGELGATSAAGSNGLATIRGKVCVSLVEFETVLRIGMAN
jgi:hypothetical protein